MIKKQIDKQTSYFGKSVDRKIGRSVDGSIGKHCRPYGWIERWMDRKIYRMIDQTDELIQEVAELTDTQRVDRHTYKQKDTHRA